MTTALVTGAAGFLGSHVAEHLLAMGTRVVALDDLSGGLRRNVPTGCEWQHGSIEDELLIDRLFRRCRFDWVFHLAAYAAEGLSHFIRHFNYRVNLIGSVNLINASVRYGVRRFVFTSSAAVYGPGDGPLDERDAPRPCDPYGIAKFAVEQDLQAAAEMFGLRYVIFRPHNVYGERQNLSDPFRNVIGIFMRQVMSGRPCTIFGDGSQTRAFSYVSDVAPIIARSVRSEEAVNQVFNIGAAESTSVENLARRIQRAMGRHVGVEYLPARHEVHDVCCSHAKLRQVFGVGKTAGLPEGLSRMARWAESETLPGGSRWPTVEITRGLPSSWADLLLGSNQGQRQIGVSSDGDAETPHAGAETVEAAPA